MLLLTNMPRSSCVVVNLIQFISSWVKNQKCFIPCVHSVWRLCRNMQKLLSRLQNVVENLRGAALSESRFSIHFACHDKVVHHGVFVMSCTHVSFVVFQFGSFTSIDWRIRWTWRSWRVVSICFFGKFSRLKIALELQWHLLSKARQFLRQDSKRQVFQMTWKTSSLPLVSRAYLSLHLWVAIALVQMMKHHSLMHSKIF